MNIEIEPRVLVELLENAEIGIQEIKEYSPELANTFKELVQKITEAGYTREYLTNFANSLSDADEDYPLMEEDDDYDY